MSTLAEGQVAPSPRPASGPMLDAGWLFLLAGLALLVATVLIPAQRDVAKARFSLEQARAVEDNRLERMRRYQEYLDALNRGDEATVRALAAVQLNQASEGTALLMNTGELGGRNASVFPSLEPPPIKAAQWREDQSVLERWATDDRSRLWLIAAGAMCVLIGILPPARPRGG
ncbi:MAG: hypothetical protein ACKVS8_02810 [Phycisphaerales bacterium]